MVDWTQLPNELLQLISKRLDTRFDFICFRSVCSAWRASAATSPVRHRLSPRCPLIPADNGRACYSSVCPFRKRTVFLVRTSKNNAQADPSASWFIKTEKEVHVPNNSTVGFVHPLLRSSFSSLDYDFPKALSLLDFRVWELGQEYNFYRYDDDLYWGRYVGKVALHCLDSNANDFVALSIVIRSSNLLGMVYSSDKNNLAMLRSSDKKWTLIHDRACCYSDVILYKGNLYAVDVSGRTVVVGLDFKVSMVAVPVYGGRKKFLVESKGELLLADMYFGSYFDRWTSNKFKVYKLDKVGKRWTKVDNLGDGVLFLGADCSFAASAEDLSVCRGNCIIFVDIFDPSGVCVFDLENDSTGPLCSFPQFSKLFLPPSSWSSSSTTLNTLATTSSVSVPFAPRGDPPPLPPNATACLSVSRLTMAERANRPVIPSRKVPYSLSEHSKPISKHTLRPHGVLELGQEYVFNSFGREIVRDMPWCMRKAALYCLDSSVNNDFVLLSILAPLDKLAMFKFSDKKWTTIEDTPFRYDDVILYKGNFYAVDFRGRAVVVGLDSKTSVVGVPVYGGEKKFLVESKGALFLVDMYRSFVVEDETGSSSWTGKFVVFKLGGVGKKWIEVKDLEDCVLFLGTKSTFAASAEDLSVCKGNYIIFSNRFHYYLHGEGKPSSKGWDVCVFDLENDSTGPLWKFPQFGKLFMPPSSWSSSRTVNVSTFYFEVVL
ncbi:hypothetical protein PTKIN_Ptkin10aG0168100 [Pterospermum kingtungense]